MSRFIVAKHDAQAVIRKTPRFHELPSHSITTTGTATTRRS
jgi:hypothetical protein